MNDILASIKEQLPYYLTQERKDGVLKALKDFPENMRYYRTTSDSVMWQGDCWSRFQLFNFKSGERKNTLGIVLSNTCDISPENTRDTPTKIVFASIIPLNIYQKILESSGLAADQIENKIKDIKGQNVSSLFYLPASSEGFDEDHLALLDDIHSMPLKDFIETVEKKRRVALSLAGFYIFIFKLSIHFCRFHDEGNRD